VQLVGREWPMLAEEVERAVEVEFTRSAVESSAPGTSTAGTMVPDPWWRDGEPLGNCDDVTLQVGIQATLAEQLVERTRQRGLGGESLP
jgi:hypothetical protein